MRLALPCLALRCVVVVVQARAKAEASASASASVENAKQDQDAKPEYTTTSFLLTGSDDEGDVIVPHPGRARAEAAVRIWLGVGACHIYYRCIVLCAEIYRATILSGN